MMDWNGFRRMRSWPSLGIFPEWLRKTANNLHQDRESLGRDSYRITPEYKSGTIPWEWDSCPEESENPIIISRLSFAIREFLLLPLPKVSPSPRKLKGKVYRGWTSLHAIITELLSLWPRYEEKIFLSNICRKKIWPNFRTECPWRPTTALAPKPRFFFILLEKGKGPMVQNRPEFQVIFGERLLRHYDTEQWSYRQSPRFGIFTFLQRVHKEREVSFVSVFFRTCSILLRMDFGWASSHSDGNPSLGYALCYKSMYERNFLMRIFVKQGFSVHHTTMKFPTFPAMDIIAVIGRIRIFSYTKKLINRKVDTEKLYRFCRASRLALTLLASFREVLHVDLGLYTDYRLKYFVVSLTLSGNIPG
jgi:hypothetical protein